MKLENLTKLVAASITLLFQSAFADFYELGPIDQDVAAITTKKLNKIETSLDEASLLASPEFVSLQTKCSSDWAQIVENVGAINGGQEAVKLVVYALGNLSTQDYITAVETLTTKYESGAATEVTIETVLSPLGRMTDFFDDNYNHARVIAVLNRIKTKTNKAALKTSIDETLSGSGKTMKDEYRDAHDGLPEGGTPKVILPP